MSLNGTIFPFSRKIKTRFLKPKKGVTYYHDYSENKKAVQDVAGGPEIQAEDKMLSRTPGPHSTAISTVHRSPDRVD